MLAVTLCATALASTKMPIIGWGGVGREGRFGGALRGGEGYGLHALHAVVYVVGRGQAPPRRSRKGRNQADRRPGARRQAHDGRRARHDPRRHHAHRYQRWCIHRGRAKGTREIGFSCRRPAEPLRLTRRIRPTSGPPGGRPLPVRMVGRDHRARRSIFGLRAAGDCGIITTVQLANR